MSYISSAGGSGDTNDLGYFANPTALRAAYPTAVDGNYATIGSTDSIWIWDTTTSDWVNSGAGTYVPYSGAVAGVNLGSNDLSATVLKTVNSGSRGIQIQSSGVQFQDFSFFGSKIILSGSEMGDEDPDQTILLPNASGTVALLTDIPAAGVPYVGATADLQLGQYSLIVGSEGFAGIIKAYQRVTPDANGCTLYIDASNGDGAGQAGDIYMRGGIGAGSGGNFYFTPGAANYNGGTGGSVFITGGVGGQTYGSGGNIYLKGGNTISVFAGGTIDIDGGDNQYGGTGSFGGNIILSGGFGDGNLTQGFIYFRNKITNYFAKWDLSLLTTTTQTFKLPNASGTIALDLTVAPVQTANYAANPHEFIPCDISLGGFAVTLPNAPDEGTVVEVKLTKIDSITILDILTQGTDVFNVAGGNTAIYLNLLNTVATFTYNAATGIWYADISTPGSAFATEFPGVNAQTPITNDNILVDAATRTVTVIPPLGYFYVNVVANGRATRIRKTGVQTFPAFTDTSGMWYFYFDNTGTAVTTQTAWTVEDFEQKVPIYRLLWNNTLYNFTTSAANVSEGDTYTNNGQTFTVRQTYTGSTLVKMVGTGDPEVSGTLTRATGTGDATITFSAFDVTPRLVAQYIEYHLNTIPADVHQHFHLGGAIWETGFTIANNALVSGVPNADGRNTVIALTSGTNMDDNLDYDVTNTPTPTNPWDQDLGDTTPATLNATNAAMFTVFRQNAAGLVTFRDETRFPFDWSTVTNVPNYITATGVRTPVGNGNFFVNFVYATQNPVSGQAIKVVSATVEFTTITDARAFTWTSIQNAYPSIFSDGEIRPLYRLIHERRTTYDAGAKYAVLRETQDLRKAAVTSTTAASGSIPATSVTVVPGGTLGSTNVQSALLELDSDKAVKSGIFEVTSVSVNDGGTGYTAGDILLLNEVAYCKVIVDSELGGVITGVSVYAPGDQDNIPATSTVSGGTGSDAIINIDTTAELPYLPVRGTNLTLDMNGQQIQNMDLVISSAHGLYFYDDEYQTTTYGAIYSQSPDTISIEGTQFAAELDFSSLTSTQNLMIPDQSGTIALTSDIPVVDTTPKVIFTTGFEGTTTRLGSNQGNGGTITIISSGLRLSSAVQTGAYSLVMGGNITQTVDFWDRNPYFATTCFASTSTAGDGLLGWGLRPSDWGTMEHTQTGNKGVWFVKEIVSGVVTLWACVSDGTNVTATDITGALNTEIGHIYAIKVNSGTNVIFYIDGVVVNTTTTNLPTGTADVEGRLYMLELRNGVSDATDRLLTISSLQVEYELY